MLVKVSHNSERRVAATDLLGTVEVQHKLELTLVTHLLLPTLEVVLVAREAVDKEFLGRALLHSLCEGR